MKYNNEYDENEYDNNEYDENEYDNNEYDENECGKVIDELNEIMRTYWPDDYGITGYIGDDKSNSHENKEDTYERELVEVNEVESYIGIVDENELDCTSNYTGMNLNQLNILTDNSITDNSINHIYHEDENILNELRQMKEEIRNIKDILSTKTKEEKQKQEVYDKLYKLNSFIDAKVDEINSYSNIYNTSSYKENSYVKEMLKNFKQLNPKLKKQDIVNVAILTFIEKFNK